MRAIALLLAFTAFFALASAQAGSTWIQDNCTVGYPLAADTLAWVICGADCAALDYWAPIELIVDEGQNLVAATALAAYAVARVTAGVEVNVFIAWVNTADNNTRAAALTQYQAQIAVQQANFTAQKAQFIADIQADIANWKSQVAALEAFQDNVTGTNMQTLAQRIKILYDAWLLHLQRRNIEAKIYLGHRYAALAELHFRYASALMWVVQKAIAVKTVNPSNWPAAVNETMITQQLIALDTEIHVREEELALLFAIYAQAVTRAIAAVAEATAKLLAFQAKVYRLFADIRADLADSNKGPQILDDIRRRVISWVTNCTDVIVVIDTTSDPKHIKVTITVVKNIDGQDKVVIQATLQEVVKRILAAIATYDDSHITSTANPPTRKRGASSDTYVVNAQISSSATAAISLAALALAALATLL